MARDAEKDSPFVEWGGCAGVRSGPVCEIGKERTLTLWIGGVSELNGTVRTDHGPALLSAKRRLDDGVQLEVTIPPATRLVELTDGQRHLSWSLKVDEPTAHAEIDRIVTLGHTGKYQAALLELEALRERSAPDDRGPLDAAIGRMSLSLGNVERAEGAFRASIARAIREGRLGDAVRDSSALIWALVMLKQRFSDARSALETMKAVGRQFPEGRVWIDYHVALLAEHTGDIRTALHRYRAAEREGRRIGSADLANHASMGMATQLSRIGRAEEGLSVLEGASKPTDSCARASWELNVAWMSMVRSRDRLGGGPDQRVWDALSSAERETSRCPDPHHHLVAVVNSAEYALETDDVAQIARLLPMIAKLPRAGEVLFESWRSDVLGRWYLRRRLPGRALSLFQEQIRLARGAGLFNEVFRGKLGEGLAWLALGRRQTAVAVLKDAQDLLESIMRAIPLGEGRGSFLGDHDEGIRNLVGALVAGGAAGEALAVARKGRSAELLQSARLDRIARLTPEARRRWDEALERYEQARREIEALSQSDWTVPREQLAELRASRQGRAELARGELDEAFQVLMNGPRDLREAALPQPRSGQLYLAFFPGPRGWFAFAADPTKVVVRAIDSHAFTSQSEAAKVLALFDKELAGAREVRLLPYGAADHVNWHAVSWRGHPLCSLLDVAYGMDLPVRPRPPQPAATQQIALIVSDPNGDLPASRIEERFVAEELAGWQLVRLQGAKATREALLTALTRAGLFHYAGHAEIAGPQGMSSALLLDGNGRVEIGDLLAAPSVPDLVILSACEAGGTSSLLPSLMGLGQAFIAAGAGAVIAPGGKISDTAAHAFMSAFYPAFLATRAVPGTPACDAFKLAVRSILADAAASRTKAKAADGWESFRLFEP